MINFRKSKNIAILCLFILFFIAGKAESGDFKIDLEDSAGNSSALIKNKAGRTILRIDSDGKGTQGINNIALGNVSTVGGGGSNRANGNVSVIGGGRDNLTIGIGSVIGGGALNKAVGIGSFIGGGQLNRAVGTMSTISGGISNTVTGQNGTVGGGEFNNATGINCTVSGGRKNVASPFGSVVGGGSDNMATGFSSSVFGGERNLADGHLSFIGGGGFNNTKAFSSVVVGGGTNTAAGVGSFIGCGFNNLAFGPSSVVVGGENNRATGYGSFVVGGEDNTATGDLSFAAGFGAKANHEGTFVWSGHNDDHSNVGFGSTAPSQFLIRADGGVGIGTSTPASELHVIGTVTANAVTVKNNIVIAGTNVGNLKKGQESITDTFSSAVTGTHNFTNTFSSVPMVFLTIENTEATLVLSTMVTSVSQNSFSYVINAISGTTTTSKSINLNWMAFE